jgi:hypothetical protein
MRATILDFTTAAVFVIASAAWLAVTWAAEAPQPAAPTAAAAPLDEEQEIQAAIAELPEADRPLAVAQRWCAVEQDNRLGSMGAPIKVILDGKPVFLCCSGCTKRAKANVKATLGAAATLTKVTANLAKLSANDRREAESQKFCVIKQQVRLGSTGTPVKVTIDGKPIFVCCSSCAIQAAERPSETLSKATALRAKNATR